MTKAQLNADLKARGFKIKGNIHYYGVCVKNGTFKRKENLFEGKSE